MRLTCSSLIQTSHSSVRPIRNPLVNWNCRWFAPTLTVASRGRAEEELILETVIRGFCKPQLVRKRLTALEVIFSPSVTGWSEPDMPSPQILVAYHRRKGHRESATVPSRLFEGPFSTKSADTSFQLPQHVVIGLDCRISREQVQ